MTSTTRRLTARLATGVAAGLLTVGLASAPATALRLVPVDPPTAVGVTIPVQDPSLLLTLGRLSAPGGIPTGTGTGTGTGSGSASEAGTGTVSDTGAELFMSSGRLSR